MLASASTSIKLCEALNIATESTEIFWWFGLSAQFQKFSFTFLRTAGEATCDCAALMPPAASAAPPRAVASDCLRVSALPLALLLRFLSILSSRHAGFPAFSFFVSALHSPSRETAHQHSLEQQEDQRDRQRAHQGPRSADAPDGGLAQRELAHDHGQRLHVGRRCQQEGEEEVVPGHDEGEQPARDEARQRER